MKDKLQTFQELWAEFEARSKEVLRKLALVNAEYRVWLGSPADYALEYSNGHFYMRDVYDTYGDNILLINTDFLVDDAKLEAFIEERNAELRKMKEEAERAKSKKKEAKELALYKKLKAKYEGTQTDGL